MLIIEALQIVKLSIKLQGTLFIYWSMVERANEQTSTNFQPKSLYWGLHYICISYIGNWRINKLLLPHNHYHGAKNPLTKAFVLLAPFLDKTNIIKSQALLICFQSFIKKFTVKHFIKLFFTVKRLIKLFFQWREKS